MFQKFKKPIILFIFVSILVHIGFFKGLEIASKFTKIKNSFGQNQIEIEIIEAPAQTQEQAKTKQQDVKIRQQIVDQNKKQINEEKPKDSRFLSRHNQRVVRQTKADKSGQFKNAVKKGQSDKGVERQKLAKRPKPKPKLENGNIPSLSQLKPNLNFQPTADDKEDQPSLGSQSQTPDYLKDVKKGVQTLLSTREFVYFSYYSRIREKIRQHWVPNIRQKVKILFQKGRSIASARDRITRIVVTLDGEGGLVGVHVITESGLKDLDDAAVDAFRAAAPFPNPPDGLVEGDGKIRIHWDFILEASSNQDSSQDYYAKF